MIQGGEGKKKERSSPSQRDERAETGMPTSRWRMLGFDLGVAQRGAVMNIHASRAGDAVNHGACGFVSV